MNLDPKTKKAKDPSLPSSTTLTVSDLTFFFNKSQNQYPAEFPFSIYFPISRFTCLVEISSISTTNNQKNHFFRKLFDSMRERKYRIHLSSNPAQEKVCSTARKQKRSKAIGSNPEGNINLIHVKNHPVLTLNSNHFITNYEYNKKIIHSP